MATRRIYTVLVSLFVHYCCPFNTMCLLCLEQWSSTSGTRTAGGTRRRLRGCTKISYGVCKFEKKNVIDIE
jgi:hypothetical protein